MLLGCGSVTAAEVVPCMDGLTVLSSTIHVLALSSFCLCPRIACQPPPVFAAPRIDPFPRACTTPAVCFFSSHLGSRLPSC